MLSRSVYRLLTVSACLSLMSCSEKSEDMMPAMMEAADSGPTYSDAMAQPPEVDAGVEMECNAITGEGCMDGNFCFYIGDPIGVQCRLQADPPIDHAEECRRSLQNCKAGFYCVLFQGESGNSKCRKVCDRSNHDDCEGLTGNADGFECKQTIDAKRNLGVCSPVLPECLPYDDMCEMGEYCEYTGGRIRCVDVGTGRRGGSCDVRQRCEKGSICITVNNEARCYEPCDPVAPSCSNSSHSCEQQTSLQGKPLIFGICK